MASKLWTVDAYCDKLCEREEKAVQAQLAIDAKWGHSRMNVFQDREAAIEFMLHRAENNVTIAEVTLDKLRRKFKQLQKKYAISQDARRDAIEERKIVREYLPLTATMERRTEK